MASVDLERLKSNRAHGHGPGRLKRWARTAAREPLLHFMIVGLVLFCLLKAYRRGDDQHRIMVTPAVVTQLKNGYRLQFGHLPDASTTEALIDQFIGEEVLYRQGLALHLDRNDEVIRHRIVQKAQFVQQDLTLPPAPTEAAVEQYYRRNQARYTAPQKVSFSHIFFAGEDASSMRRAKSVLASLNDGEVRAPEKGDNFPDLYDYVDFGHDQVERLFGPTELTRTLFTAPPGHWVGPLRSAYGWHLVRVQAATAPAVRPFSEVKDQVRADLQAESGDAANLKALQALKSEYQVVRTAH